MPLELATVLKRVKKIEIETRRLVTELFAGEYHSVFKGLGVEFSEVREYQPGDDVRTIDWNVTARMRHPYIKKYREERQLNVVLVVDVSASSQFGTFYSSKMELAAEVAAVLAFSAIRNNDRVGLLTFSDKIEKFLPPKRSKSYGMRIIREILYWKTQGRGTDIHQALEYLIRVLTRRSIIFIISDFIDLNFEKTLGVLSRKHDVVALQIRDEGEISLPKSNMIVMEDLETGETLSLNPRNIKWRELFDRNQKQHQEKILNIFRKYRTDHALLVPGKSFTRPLSELFKKRERR